MPSGNSKPSRQSAARSAYNARRTYEKGPSVRVDWDQSGADAALDNLLDAALEAVRPAAQAGSQTLYIEALLRCPVSAEEHVFYGRDSVKTGVTWTFQPGNLRNSIYQAFSKDNSIEAGPGYQKATYHISWNHQDAPYGFMVEFGTSRAAPHPFLRPAYESAKRDALDDARVEYAKQLRNAGVIA
jgi:HK97 gp10 family phage protein